MYQVLRRSHLILRQMVTDRRMDKHESIHRQLDFIRYYAIINP